MTPGSAPGAPLSRDGGYQFNVLTKGLTTGQKMVYELVFRVSTDVEGVTQTASFILK